MSQQSHISSQDVRSALEKLPRVPLANLPTPLEECPRLSEALSPGGKGPRIFIKRDDLTGQALGGNKVRHLETRLGDALARGCDTFIYADKSNAARATAAACAKLGMRCVLLVASHRDIPLQGNLLMARVLGAELVFLESTDPMKALAEVPVVEKRLREEGRKPYALQQLPWFDISGVASYLQAALELDQQLRDRGIDRSHFYLVAGHSQIGLQLYGKLLGLHWKATGVLIGQPNEADRAWADWCRTAVDHMGFPTSLSLDEIDIAFACGPEEYAVPTEAGAEAIKLTARTESVILDPTYTGKAMSVLIDHVRRGKVDPDEALVFVHTGGIPVLFESAQGLSKFLEPERVAAGGKPS